MRTITIGILFTSILTLCGGCKSFSGSKDSKLKEANESLVSENQQLTQQLKDLQSRTAELSEELAALRGFGDDRLKNLVYPESIEFGRYTRGDDTDNDGIDNGVIVYLVVRDRRGDVIKAAGSVKIELWDLAGSPDHQKLGVWDYPIDQLGQYWLGGLLADHYRFTITWPEGKTPEHSHITIKLVFNDALTGRSFEIQKLLQIAIPHSN